MDKWVHRTGLVEHTLARVCFVTSFLFGVDADFYGYWWCKDISFIFAFFLFFYRAFFTSVENTYKNPYSLKAVKYFSSTHQRRYRVYSVIFYSFLCSNNIIIIVLIGSRILASG
jgi:hypothetical protein